MSQNVCRCCSVSAGGVNRQEFIITLALLTLQGGKVFLVLHGKKKINKLTIVFMCYYFHTVQCVYYHKAAALYCLCCSWTAALLRAAYADGP